ncbi:MAG: SpoIIE family protein phosphatase, partial [Acidobacteriaceae bacterium]|nr:SpoIIE family protein phosphatase [Acidobacteriaceae bacterium]
LAPGDLLVIFTDGLIEAENDKEEEFGELRMLTILSSRSDMKAPEVLKDLMSSADQFVGTAPQHDDITCLVMRLVPD